MLGSEAVIYGTDLAWIQSVGFGGLARGAAPEIIRRLRMARVERVVDAGCGAGELTATLCDAGFAVTAIDTSAELLAIARARASRAEFVEGSLHEIDLPECEAIVALGEPLTYEPTDVGRFFKRAAECLPQGGLLIFDVIETGEPSLNAKSWISGEDWAVGVETTELGNQLTRSIETFRRVGELYRRGREVHRVRLFDTKEVLTALAALGFSVETATAYGAQTLAQRRRAFFCTRL